MKIVSNFYNNSIFILRKHICEGRFNNNSMFILRKHICEGRFKFQLKLNT